MSDHGALRGRRSEQAVINAARHSTMPAWIRSVRAAYHWEDAQGIDVVVETDDGELYLQVKSSPKGAARFDPRGRPIGVVVAGDAEPEVVRRRVLAALERLR